jgi:outer membrane lipoprotein-sorting protein
MKTIESKLFRGRGSRKRFFLAVLAALSVGTVAAADERGQAIVRRVDELERAATSRSVMEMTVRPADGSAPRTFSVLAYERGGSGDLSLVEFAEPRSVRGLRILSKGSDSWVYFPSTGRVRKIAGSSRSGSVQGVGGDFSYDDLGGGSWAEDYDFSVLSEDSGSWELEGLRKAADAAYDSVKLRVDKTLELPLRATFAKSSEGGYYKELSFSAHRDFDGRTRAAEMTMRNLKKGSSTVVVLREAAFDLPLEDRLFDPSRFDK